MQVVANSLVGPDDVTVSLTDIGGLQSIIHRLVRVMTPAVAGSMSNPGLPAGNALSAFQTGVTWL